MLITADLHLTDAPLEEYRWGIFDALEEIALKFNCRRIGILGDITDRKDRHSAVLLNRLCTSLIMLQHKTQTEVDILSGNHDGPISGPHYWNILNGMQIAYITSPELIDGVFWLPFAANPIDAWKELPLEKAKAYFIHQTVKGALIEGNRKLEHGTELPIFPRGKKVYSGDVHRPQVCGQVTYIGAPHPVRFGEDWSNRVLVFQNGDVTKDPIEIRIDSIKRSIVEISKAEDLVSLPYEKGDQLRIRYKLLNSNLSSWPVEQQEIRKWAEERKVNLVSLEANLIEDPAIQKTSERVADTFEVMAPSEVIRMYGIDQKLDQAVIDMGLELTQEATK